MTTPKYENLDTAEKVERAFADGRDVEWRHVKVYGQQWFPALVLRRDGYEYDFANGVEYRAPESQCPAHGGDDRPASMYGLVGTPERDQCGHGIPTDPNAPDDYLEAVERVSYALKHADSNQYSHEHYENLARAALAALPAQLSTDADAKDAARYRWLRECGVTRSDRTMYVQRNNYEAGKFRGTDFPSGDQLDDVIDDALRAAHAAEEPQA